jgi:hypothetical protein
LPTEKKAGAPDDLDAALAERCCILLQATDIVKSHTNFHWWPKFINPG